MNYQTANQYYKHLFGCKVYKLCLDAGMTCPNRDGTLSTAGCRFCAGGSGNFAVPVTENIAVCLEKAAEKVKQKNPSGRYLAYLQSYCNTYAPLKRLKQLYGALLEQPQIVGLCIATRPDLLPEPVIQLLEQLNAKKPVILELGLQTAFDQTANAMNRSYPLSVYNAVMTRLNQTRLHVIVHQIIGLPGENADMALQTTRHIVQSGAGGIKFHLLHVLKGTGLAADYDAGKFSVLSMTEYADILLQCLRLLPPNMVVHRITGDAPKSLLIAPLWSADKKRVLNYLNRRIENELS